MKRILSSAFIIATMALGAQTQKMKKACIKIESDNGGHVTKIDTCVTAATDAELQQKLDALGYGGMSDLPPLPPVPPVPPVPPAPGEDVEISIQVDTSEGNGYEYTYTKAIVIDDATERSGNKRSGDNKKMKIITKQGGKGSSQVIVVDGDGQVITSDVKGGDKSGNNVMVKRLKPGEKMDPEIEKMLKEQGLDDGKTEGKKIIIKNHENRNGKESNEVKVYVFSKMEVKKLSDAERKQLPADASKALANGKTFDDLTMAPNPTEDACTITYHSASKEPLQIKVYNTEGKTVMTETDSNVGDQVNKTLSLKGLGQGVYFLHLTQGKQSEVRKIIVK